jgi:hypothetical protein
MSDTQSGFFDNLVSAVRDNPLPAALIGGGALWLLIGNDKLKNAANSTTSATSSLADIGARNVRAAMPELHRTTAPPTAPEMDHEGSLRLSESLHDARKAASEGVSGAAEKIKDGFDDGMAYARDNISKLGNPLRGKKAFTQAQSSLADMLENQPLLLGLVGLAIGGVFASAFRSTDLENEWVGEFSDDVKADLNTRAAAVSQSLREASDTLQAEVSDTGAEAVDRLKQAGVDAVDAAQERLKSP